MKTNNLKLDPLGYFLIRITETKTEVAFCNYQKEILDTFEGDKDTLFSTITNKLQDLTPDHLLYLKNELTRAEAAIKTNQVYIQD